MFHDFSLTFVGVRDKACEGFPMFFVEDYNVVFQKFSNVI